MKRETLIGYQKDIDGLMTTERDRRWLEKCADHPSVSMDAVHVRMIRNTLEHGIGMGIALEK